MKTLKTKREEALERVEVNIADYTNLINNETTNKDTKEKYKLKLKRAKEHVENLKAKL